MLSRTFILRAIGASLGLWLSLVSVRAFATGSGPATRRTTFLTLSGTPSPDREFSNRR